VASLYGARLFTRQGRRLDTGSGRGLLPYGGRRAGRVHPVRAVTGRGWAVAVPACFTWWAH